MTFEEMSRLTAHEVRVYARKARESALKRVSTKELQEVEALDRISTEACAALAYGITRLTVHGATPYQIHRAVTILLKAFPPDEDAS